MIQLEQLAPIRPCWRDNALFTKLLADSRVLVTGGGGTIGTGLIVRLLQLGVSHIRVVEHSEQALYELMVSAYGQHIEPVLGDLMDSSVLQRAVPDVDIVFHAAAYKHVPILEHEPLAAIRNNFLATRKLLESCKKHSIERVVCVSTDKAVEPISWLGITKKLVEWDARREGVVCVRLPNVWNSSGGVIPRMVGQASRHMPVTLTDSEATRFFVSLDEAVDAIISAAALGIDCATLVADPGPAVRILDIASMIVKSAGLGPEMIRKIGLRPGDKLHEQLFATDEERQPTSISGIYQATPRSDTLPVSMDNLAASLEAALTAADVAAANAAFAKERQAS